MIFSIATIETKYIYRITCSSNYEGFFVLTLPYYLGSVSYVLALCYGGSVCCGWVVARDIEYAYLCSEIILLKFKVLSFLPKYTFHVMSFTLKH
jgi:hypothetical protein